MDSKTGRCAILFPHGVLFRKEEADMRQKLVDADLVDCVLGLDGNLFYNSAMEACVVICRNKKPAKRRGKVIFIDGVKEVVRERAMSFLKPEHQERIANAYHDFKDIEGFAVVATLKEIQANGGNLNVPLYVRGHILRDEKGEYDSNGLKEAISNWKESSSSLENAIQNLIHDLE